MDVYGRLWMAPRAGSEIDYKFVMRKDLCYAKQHSTPSDTPKSEHMICNQGVGGSNPSAGTKLQIRWS